MIVTNTDRDTTPPMVSGLIAIQNGSSINGFVITFDKPMDPARASMVSNYYIFETNGSSKQTPVPLAAALYDPFNNSVTLVPTRSLPNNHFYHIIANGTYGLALTDTSGNILSGSTGPNSNYDVYYGQGTNLTYVDAHHNSVNIKLTGGGTMGIYLGSNGNATSITLYGIVPRKSKLSGSVKKLTKNATGHTNIGQIIGLGKFGDVYSTLTTPSFYVAYAPVSTSSVSAASLNISALSDLTTSVVTTTKKTPKGPSSLKN